MDIEWMNGPWGLASVQPSEPTIHEFNIWKFYINCDKFIMQPKNSIHQSDRVIMKQSNKSLGISFQYQ